MTFSITVATRGVTSSTGGRGCGTSSFIKIGGTMSVIARGGNGGPLNSNTLTASGGSGTSGVQAQFARNGGSSNASTARSSGGGAAGRTGAGGAPTGTSPFYGIGNSPGGNGGAGAALATGNGGNAQSPGGGGGGPFKSSGAPAGQVLYGGLGGNGIVILTYDDGVSSISIPTRFLLID
jgi:hypothetical protein